MGKDPANQWSEEQSNLRISFTTNETLQSRRTLLHTVPVSFGRVTYYDGSPNTILSSSIEVIHASEWIGTPSDFKTSRPPSKVFSINAPMPTIFDPEASASRAKPKIVCPLARKSSMINTFSPFARYSGETINSTIRPFVWEGASVRYTWSGIVIGFALRA